MIEEKLRYMYRITAVLNIKTDIIASIAASPMEQDVIPVIVYVDTFKPDIIIFICSMFDITLTDHFQ